MVTPLLSGPEVAPARLILAHGAGAPMTSPFLEQLCSALGSAGVHTQRFEFSYMAERRAGRPKRPPPRIDVLCGEYCAFVAEQRLSPGQRLFIGGKSMGGRVASMIADDLFAAGVISGLVVAGYPFHPPRKPDVLRVSHLQKLMCPALIIQGTRDLLGGAELVPGLLLSRTIAIAWMPDGDHDLKPRRQSGFSNARHITAAALEIAEFMAAKVP